MLQINWRAVYWALQQGRERIAFKIKHASGKRHFTCYAVTNINKNVKYTNANM